MKAYTSIAQSQKLAEILPLESADMKYMFLKRDGSAVSNVPFIKDGFEECDGSSNTTPSCYDVIPCWSIVALFNVLSAQGKVRLEGNKDNNYWYCEIIYSDINKYAGFEDSDNPLDACCNMVIRLHRINRL